jgi:hypothetical protein
MRKVTTELLDRAKIPYEIVTSYPHYNKVPEQLRQDFEDGLVSFDMFLVWQYLHEKADWGLGETRMMSARRILRDVWHGDKSSPSLATVQRILLRLEETGRVVLPQKYRHMEGYTIKLTNYAAQVAGLDEGTCCILRPTFTTGYRDEPEAGAAPFAGQETNRGGSGAGRVRNGGGSKAGQSGNGGGAGVDYTLLPSLHNSQNSQNSQNEQDCNTATTATTARAAAEAAALQSTTTPTPGAGDQAWKEREPEPEVKVPVEDAASGGVSKPATPEAKLREFLFRKILDREPEGKPDVFEQVLRTFQTKAHFGAMLIWIGHSPGMLTKLRKADDPYNYFLSGVDWEGKNPWLANEFIAWANKAENSEVMDAMLADARSLWEPGKAADAAGGGTTTT